MKNIVKYIPIVIIIMITSSCSHKHEETEDKIKTDLNDVFDPNHEGDTDWNYTDIDDDRIKNVRLYNALDYNISASKQKQSDKEHKKESKPMNPITQHLIFFGVVLLLFELWLLYATYQVAYEKNRIVWLWLFNSFTGGIGNFIILSLSKELKCDKDLDIREQPDLLGITIAVGNATLFILLFFFIRLYIAITQNPNILREFLNL